MKAVRTLVVAAVVLSLSVGSISASQVGLSVEMSNPVLKALKKQTTFLKVGLTGFKMQSRAERAPVNISLVLDKSGSMKGSPMEEARSGAIEAIRRLGPNDIVSVITYDSTVHVLVPATKLTDKDTVCRQISQIRAGGGTALFAGVSKGAAEIRKFADRNYVNRVILLSDGKANIGPSSPSELGNLGASFKKENMTVSTMGLGPGYNEDLMLMLASRSGGNHIFIEDTAQLAGIFHEEFKTVLSVVAQEVSVAIDVSKAVRPIRVLGREAEINGQQVITQLSQIYSEQEQYVVLEVEVPATSAGKATQVASVSVTYGNMLTQATDRLAGTASVNFSDNATEIAEKTNRDVLEVSILLLANERNKMATAMFDTGKIEEAKKCLEDNASFLSFYATQLDSEDLKESSSFNARQALELKAAPNTYRKRARSNQFKVEQQRAY